MYQRHGKEEKNKENRQETEIKAHKGICSQDRYPHIVLGSPYCCCFSMYKAFWLCKGYAAFFRRK